MKYQKGVILVLLLLPMLSGCNTRSIRIDPIPQLKTGSPLSGIEPLTFVVNEFDDVRPDKKLVGSCRIGPLIVLEDQKVPEIIAHAIANELRRNGHTVLGPHEADKADVIIDGIVRQYWIQSNNYTFSIRITGTVGTEIRFTSRKIKDGPLSKTYRGEYYYETSGIISASIWENAINQALLELIKELGTDEEFLKWMSQVKRQDS